MWNMFIGRSFLEKIEPVKVSKEEIPLDNSASTEFDINNAKTWSKDCISHIENNLRVNEIPTDGLVCLFSVPNPNYCEARYGSKMAARYGSKMAAR